MPAPNYYDQGQQNLQTAFGQAANTASARSRDTAAARVRSRLSNTNRGQINAINNAGTRNVGLQSARLNSQYRSNQNALATGLAGVEQDYRENQLTAAKTMGELAGTQTDSANRFQTNVNEGQEVANRLRIGLGNTETDRIKAAETERSNRLRELQDFYNAFVTSGATLSESEAFNRRFQDLITRMFGSQGLTAGGADELPVVSTVGQPGVAGNLYGVGAA